MYKKILVPLDGSELAECVLPHVESIAKGCGTGSVVFARVVEPVTAPYGAMGDAAAVITEQDTARMRAEIDASNKNEAEKYINQLVSRQKYEGVKVQSELITGKTSDSIAEYATKNDVDLIIIATHGRSGISRWVWGSVADRILRSACVPVLMVRAPGCVPNI